MDSNYDYIKDLKLSTRPSRDSFPDYSMFESTAETPTFLNYKGLNSFEKDLSKQAQEDVLDCQLLAQRAASKTFPDNNQVYDWYTMYFDTLKKLGWLIDQKDFMTYDHNAQGVELDKAIFGVLEDFLTGQQVKILMKSFALLKSLGSDDKRLVAFEKNTYSSERGNFQLSLAENDQGKTTLKGSGFILESEKKITKILFLKFDRKSVKLKFNFYSATLVAHEYDKYRDLVKQKLGDATAFIASLDI